MLLSYRFVIVSRSYVHKRCGGFFVVLFFFVKQKTAYEVLISDWSSDVCSSDLPVKAGEHEEARAELRRAPGVAPGPHALMDQLGPLKSLQFGSATCRESVCQYVYIPGVAV